MTAPYLPVADPTNIEGRRICAWTIDLVIFLALLLVLAVKVTVVLDAFSHSLPDLLVLRIDETLMSEVILLQDLTHSVLSCNSLLTVKIELGICHPTLPRHLVQSSLGIVTPLRPIHCFMADWEDQAG